MPDFENKLTKIYGDFAPHGYIGESNEESEDDIHNGKVPICCTGCSYLDDGNEDPYRKPFWYCRLALIFPTRKQTCKKFRD